MFDNNKPFTVLNNALLRDLLCQQDANMKNSVIIITQYFTERPVVYTNAK